jgi:hypothetical protein
MFPMIIYRRIVPVIPLSVTPIGYTVPAGYSYLLRYIRYKHAELNAAATVFNNGLLIEMTEEASNRRPQNNPIPLRFYGSPGSAGVRIGAIATTATATGPKADRLLNKLFPGRSNLMLQLSGYTLTFPAWIDIALFGYQIKDK